MALNEITTGTYLLDTVYERVADPTTSWEALNMLCDGLFEQRQEQSSEEWKEFVCEVCSQHRLRNLLKEDPITLRSITKPRGYSGDAVLMDLIYQDPSIYNLLTDISDVGSLIYGFLVKAPAAHAVRLRLKLIARIIDDIVAINPAAEILSIACGHLREVQLFHTLQPRQFRRFVGLDHDPETIAYNSKNSKLRGIELVHGNAFHLLKSNLDLGYFDLIYGSGLFDYLNQESAQNLAAAMFRMLRPGGCMLIVNAVPGFRDAGYMEAFMDWHLIYRDLDDLADTAALIPRSRIAAQDIFLDETQNLAFFQITKQ